MSKWISYPRQSDNRQSKYTPSQMRLFQELVKLGVPCELEFDVLKEGEFTIYGQPKSYSIDILIDKKLPVEVEGKGSSSANNEERDQYLVTHKFKQPIHVSNEEIKRDVKAVALTIKEKWQG